LSSYGVSKLMNEELMKMYVRSFGLKGGAYRIFSTYGPGLKRQIVYDLIKKLQSDPSRIEVLGDGCDSRDMTYVSDQARAIHMLDREVSPSGDVFNTGSGNCYTVREILDAIVMEMGLSPEVAFTNESRSYDGKAWRADVSKLRALGWAPEVCLERGIAYTVEAVGAR
ncbi:MAG: GDP-mannose 4,6-dehydratase, partial [Deltaproteobacteria bacterium]|nr:GDP-mannose 4,6-dehydratase [Deltaproteobacteria bacterium]